LRFLPCRDDDNVGAENLNAATEIRRRIWVGS
jgi:hypothetical protein